MKKIFTPILISVYLLISGLASGQAGSIDIGLVGNDCDQLIVQWNSSYSFVGAGQNQWTQSTITITWDQSLGASVLGTITPLLPGFTGWIYNGAATLNGATYEREVILLSGSYTQDIPIGVSEIIAITLDGTGSGDFTIANPQGNTNISSFNFLGEMWSGSFSPATASGVGFDDKIVWNGSEWCGGTGTNNQPGAGDTKDCYITGTNGHLTTTGATVGSLTVETTGQLTIDPGATLTNNGNTIINSAEGLVVGAGPTGTGSFIDNGTVTYGASGSVRAEQYFIDNVTEVSFHNHFIGSMVSDPAFEAANGGAKGQFLQAYNLANTFTYAYEFLPASNTWNNIAPDSYPIYSTKGINLATTTDQNYTISMTGEIVTGSISTANGGTILASGNNLISNPYVCGIGLSNFLLVNSLLNGSITSTVRVWEGGDGSGNGGNYSTFTFSVGGTGGLTSGILNIGQGFFVESNAGNPVAFASNIAFPEKVHVNGVLLKDLTANLLRIKAKGNGFSDEILVHFSEDATNGTDGLDAEKWASIYEQSTELWTVNNENIDLTVNSMAPLGSENVSIPLSFKAGANDEYTLTASEFESFELGTEIWLEDLQTGAEWVNLIQNPVYTFTGSQDDDVNRFVLHFFGPTGIDDPGKTAAAIQIYSYDHDAYIVNRSNEVIKEYKVYDMMGRELQSGSLPNTDVNKVNIGQVSGYYIVKVITNTNVYAEKIYINR